MSFIRAATLARSAVSRFTVWMFAVHPSIAGQALLHRSTPGQTVGGNQVLCAFRRYLSRHNFVQPLLQWRLRANQAKQGLG